MKKTVTTYVCDGCGKTQREYRDLRSFNLVHRGRGRSGYDWSDNADLCDECEARLIAAIEPIMGGSVVDLRRDPTPKPTAKRAGTKA